jgi:hypothetical protein
MMSRRPRRAGDRVIEILAVVLLGIATVGSAWCGYQATRWNGEQNEITRAAAAARADSVRLFTLAAQEVAYDSNLVAKYAEARVEGNDELADFYRETLVRPEFVPLLDEWEADIAAGRTPTNLLEDERYIDQQFGDYRDAVEVSEADLAAGEEAGLNAENYVLVTLLLATALFFAGVTTSFSVRFARILLLAAACVTIAYVGTRIAELPIA